MQKATFYSLGPTNSASVLTGYRDFRIDGRGLIVIAAVHLDFADDEDEATLVAALKKVLDLPASVVSVTADPNKTLSTMHSVARRTGKYFSAAVIGIEDDLAEVSRCGLASVSTTTPPATVLRAELLPARDLAILANALGVRTFHLPLETAKLNASVHGAIAVGGALDPTDCSLGERLSFASPAEHSRGGMVLLLD